MVPQKNIDFKVAFLQNLWEDNLGIMYLSSMIKSRGFESRIFIEEKGWCEDIKAYRPNLVAFSCTTGLHHWVYNTAQQIKILLGETIPIIVGGSHPTFYPDMIRHNNVDIICRGEGEYAFLGLVERMSNHEDFTSTSNMWIKNNGEIFKNDMQYKIPNLDDIPFPDRSYYAWYPFLRKNKYKAVICSRGCPYRCSFCFNETYNNIYKGKGSIVRYRSVENVIEEITLIKSNWPLESIHFVDDLFCVKKKWFFQFAEEYGRKLRIPYTCNVRVNLIDEDVIKTLVSSGCRQILFGVESGNAELRKSILAKQITDEQIEYTAYLAHKYKIKFTTFNMIGIPNETIDDAFKTFNLNCTIKTNYPWFSICQPYPHTPLFETAVKEGLMDPIESIDDFKSTYMKDTPIKQSNIRELINLHKFFLVCIKLPFLKLLIKQLIKLPPNPIFDAIFMASYGYITAKRRGLNLFNIISLGLRTIKLFTK